MSHRNRFARATAVAGAFLLAVAMTPRADAETRGGGGSGGSRGGSSSSGHSVSSSHGGSSGHTTVSSGPRTSGGRDGFRGSAGIRTEHRGGGGRHGGGWYGGGWGGSGWGGHYGGYYPRWYSGWYWGFAPYWYTSGWLWGWPWYWDPFWTDWRYVQIYGDGGYDGYYGGGGWWRDTRGAWSSQFGRVKTDVEPEEAELYLGGKYIGTADDFDGSPDFLYLQPGTYHIEFKLGGYQTWTDDLTIKAGEVVRMRHELDREKGHGRLESFLPESKGTPSGRFFDANGNPVSPAPARARRTVRALEDHEGPIGIDDRKDRDRDRPRTDVEAVPAPDRSAASARARLRFTVTPDDAAVWVDDQYVGTADELSSRPRGTVMAPGKHTVTVVRPGYRSRTVEVEAKSGEAVDVVVDLEK